MRFLATIRPLLPRFLQAAYLITVLSCGSGESAPSEQAAGEAPATPAPAPARTAEPNAELAARGEALFQSKGCIGCHTIGGGRLTGPDLQGVTERREAPWILAMVTNPDSMVKNDATARQLFAEYMTPMLNMGVTSEEAQALYEFLRTKTQ